MVQSLFPRVTAAVGSSDEGRARCDLFPVCGTSPCPAFPSSQMLLACAIESVIFADESGKIVDNHHTLWMNVDNLPCRQRFVSAVPLNDPDLHQSVFLCSRAR